MPISSDAKFVILGCVASNLATQSYPFAVIVIEKEPSSVKSYILRGWQNVRDFFPDEVREDVLYFLDSLSDYAPGEEAERLFAHLRMLSVGPIRHISSGTCRREDTDMSIAAVLDAGHFPVMWPESFDRNGVTEPTS